uniref:Uncharacterized protein n=1 Tax=Arundo donax TaxID=35708 RepID=A0A0A9HES0_ARUDO
MLTSGKILLHLIFYFIPLVTRSH